MQLGWVKQKMEASEFLNKNNPLEKFKDWLNEAKCTNLQYADAFTLSTANKSGEVSSRVVLIKKVRADDFLFFSNYESRKGKDLEDNKNAAACFYWDPLWRQVKFTGQVEKSSRQISEDYWNSRPRASQLSQWVSKQSEPTASREHMESELRNANEKWQNESVPCPINWGGYIFTPTKVEFWIGQEARFHDRFAYHKVGGEWTSQRLYP